MLGRLLCALGLHDWGPAFIPRQEAVKAQWDRRNLASVYWWCNRRPNGCMESRHLLVNVADV